MRRWILCPSFLLLLLASMPGWCGTGGEADAQQVVKAAADGDGNGLKALLAQGASTDSAVPNGESALYFAVSNNRVETADILLAAGSAGLNDLHNQGQNRLLSVSTWLGADAMARVLIKHGADLAALDGDGRGAMAGAIAKGSLATVQVLLEAGDDPNRRWRGGQSAVAQAACYDRVDILKYLLDHKGHADLRDDLGNTPLMYAASLGREKNVRLLLERGAPVYPLNGNQRNVLGEAKHIKDPETRERMVALLREHGTLDDDPVRPLDQAFLDAAHAGDLGKVKALLAEGADLHARGKMVGGQWIPDALSGSVSHPDVCRFLLERKINVHMVSGWGFNALHSAAGDGVPATVQLLVAEGADPNARSKSGMVPLFMAINRNPDPAGVVAMLLKMGANPNGLCPIPGKSLFQLAKDRNETRVVELLKAAGAKE